MTTISFAILIHLHLSYGMIAFLRKYFSALGGNISSKEFYIIFSTEIIKYSFRY